MTHFEQLLNKLENRKAVVGIIGLGYVGLPLLIRFGEEKIKTIGFDTDLKKIDFLREQRSYIKHLENDRLLAVKDFYQATNDFSRSTECDALIICVPTPLNKYREPDLQYIESTMNSLLPYLREGQLISLESTTYPGTTEEMIQAPAEKKGLKVGENFFVIYSPEREDPGRIDFNTKTTPKVCGGITENCLTLGKKIYGMVVDKVVPVSSTKAAEMTKLLENIHRAVNIGLVNEMKIIADKMGIDIHEVIKAASSKPFGFVAYQPGPGLGGHCIPIDPFYLTWKAKEYGVHTYFIELAGEINSSMPHYVVDKYINALNDRKMSANGSRALVLGAAYKKNVDDMRESPSFEVMEILMEKKVKVDYSDPFIPKIPKLRDYSFDMESVALTRENLQQYDAVILVTDHDAFDYDFIAKNSKLIVDTRGKFAKAENIVRA